MTIKNLFWYRQEAPSQLGGYIHIQYTLAMVVKDGDWMDTATLRIRFQKDQENGNDRVYAGTVENEEYLDPTWDAANQKGRALFLKRFRRWLNKDWDAYDAGEEMRRRDDLRFEEFLKQFKGGECVDWYNKNDGALDKARLIETAFYVGKGL